MGGMSEGQQPIPAPAADPLLAGRDALGRHAWAEAFDLLSAADRDGTLGGDDLEALALSAFFSARADIGLEIKERAFQRHEAAGNVVRAAYVAVDLARTYGFTGRFSIASAWRRRAERLIGPEGDTYVHGYLALVASETAAAAGDLDTALVAAERAVAIGSTAADPDLKAYTQTNLGVLKIASGETTEGFALMERSTASSRRSPAASRRAG
jgi:tetratricopeptide (TPR) repeat protein